MAAKTTTIAHILPWSAIGGTELATLRIAQAVREYGFRSIMFCRAEVPDFARYFASHGFETVYYNAECLEKGGRVLQIRETFRLARAFKRYKIDVVHCAELLGGDYAAIAAKIAGAKLICHIRNRYDWLSRYQRLWLLTSDKLVFVSQHTKQNFGYLVKRFAGSIAERKGTVIYDGFTANKSGEEEAVDAARHDLLREVGIPPESRVVCMIARLAAQKDHLTLVKAASIVIQSHPDVRFLLVGGYGPTLREQQHKDLVFKAIKTSAACDHIVYAGFREDISHLLKAIDIFVLSTHFEGLPLVILEAMAHGKPVVATAVDGIPEVIENGRTGFLHKHQDAEELSSCINLLLSDVELARKVGKASKKFVELNFSAKRFAAAMKQLYENL